MKIKKKALGVAFTLVLFYVLLAMFVKKHEPGKSEQRTADSGQQDQRTGDKLKATSEAGASSDGPKAMSEANGGRTP